MRSSLNLHVLEAEDETEGIYIFSTVIHILSTKKKAGTKYLLKSELIFGRTGIWEKYF